VSDVLRRCRRPITTCSFLAIGIAVLLVGCASPPRSAALYRGLASSPQLQPSDDAEQPYRFRRSTADLHAYSKLIIDPVTIYRGEDSQFAYVSSQDLRAIANYMQQTFAEALAQKYQVVAKPQPGAARVHITLTGLESSVAILSTVSHLPVIGLAVNAGRQISHEGGTYFGSVSYAVEVTDSKTGALLYAYVTRQSADALDVSASVFTLDAAKAGVRNGAKRLVVDLDTESAREPVRAATVPE